MTSTPRLVAAVALGAAVGGVLRWALGLWLPVADGFPWTTFAVNVTGCLLLAGLPSVRLVRDRHALAVGLGPGLLGGFTTLSATSEQARALIDADRTPVAAAYLIGTLLAGLLAVTVAERWSRPAEQQEFADEDGDR